MNCEGSRLERRGPTLQSLRANEQPASATIPVSRPSGPRALPVRARLSQRGVTLTEAMPPIADFADLYATHVDWVRKFLKRRGMGGADLEDLTQRVFLIAFVRLSAFEGRSALSSWLYGICRRVVSAYRRSARMKYERSTDPSKLVELLDALETRGAELVLARHSEVQRALAKLPEAQRIVFVMFEVDELTGTEVASLLNLSVGTVRTRLRRARSKLRREVRRLAAKDAHHSSRPCGTT